MWYNNITTYDCLWMKICIIDIVIEFSMIDKYISTTLESGEITWCLFLYLYKSFGCLNHNFIRQIV